MRLPSPHLSPSHIYSRMVISSRQIPVDSLSLLSLDDTPPLLVCKSSLFTPSSPYEEASSSPYYPQLQPVLDVALWDPPPRHAVSTAYPPRERFRIPNFMDAHPSLRFTRRYLVVWREDEIARAALRKRQGPNLKRKWDSVEDSMRLDVRIPTMLVKALDWNLTFESCGLPPLEIHVKGLPNL